MKKTLLRASLAVLAVGLSWSAQASSHREAPLISQDPLADNTDLYAFRSPDNSNTITIIANYIPFQLPEGGPNWYQFGKKVRYEIHIKNDATTAGDDITYRFTFSQVNEDPTTFFNIRLGAQNLKTTYTCEKRIGNSGFVTVVTNGAVPPPNIGPRSIDNTTLGVGASYSTLVNNAITDATGSGGEKIYCGPADDPFFADLAGIFDLGNIRPDGNTVNAPKDALARFNVNSIALKIPIASLQKDGKTVDQAANILDGDFVIGVWASASRPQTRYLSATADPIDTMGYVQVSRIGMPLTNEAIIPIGYKDRWNATNPYNTDTSMNDKQFMWFFRNPELALYMADGAPYYGEAVPALNALRVQKKSLGQFDFRNGAAGLWPLKGNPALVGTALDPATFGDILLYNSSTPRSVDILPIFYTGVPNLAPYQLATGKPAGNPLAKGKPFINNFLPTLNDMLRLNMAVPFTPRNDPNFSSLGIVQAAVLGLTNAAYADTTLEFIPNMDGFPNGRRLEDDVTTIELQAVGGVALAAIGLWYDDYVVGGSPVTTALTNTLGFNAGITKNDTTFRTTFPYVQLPWRGFDYTYQQRF